MNAIDILQSIQWALENGDAPALILDENSPIRDAMREALKPQAPPAADVTFRPDYPFPLALNTKHRDCHKAADAFWKHWEKYGETHRHGYYESTWGAINCAIRMIGVREHHYGQMYGGDARGIDSPEGVETGTGSTATPQEPGRDSDAPKSISASPKEPT